MNNDAKKIIALIRDYLNTMYLRIDDKPVCDDIYVKAILFTEIHHCEEDVDMPRCYSYIIGELGDELSELVINLLEVDCIYNSLLLHYYREKANEQE